MNVFVLEVWQSCLPLSISPPHLMCLYCDAQVADGDANALPPIPTILDYDDDALSVVSL